MVSNPVASLKEYISIQEKEASINSVNGIRHANWKRKYHKFRLRNAQNARNLTFICIHLTLNSECKVKGFNVSSLKSALSKQAGYQHNGASKMPQTVKLTSKRQATFPVQLCRELGVSTGDDLILERKKIDGEFGWILKPSKKIESTWFAGLQKYAADKEHDMDSIRASIGNKLVETKP